MNDDEINALAERLLEEHGLDPDPSIEYVDFSHAQLVMGSTDIVKAAYDFLKSKPSIRTFDVFYGPLAPHARCPASIEFYVSPITEHASLIWFEQDDLPFWNALAKKFPGPMSWIKLSELGRVGAYIELPYAGARKTILEPRDYWESAICNTVLSAKIGQIGRLPNKDAFLEVVKPLYSPADKYWSFKKWHSAEARTKGIESVETQIKEAVYCRLGEGENTIRIVGAATQDGNDLQATIRKLIPDA